MATIKRTVEPTPKTINRFLGINENTTGETELMLGESPKMLNFRVRENYALESIRGYIELFSSLGTTDIQGMWYGKINGSFHLLFACGGNLYRREYLSTTDFDSLDDTTYTEVDIIKTRTLVTSATGTTGKDDLIRYRDKTDTELVEIAEADIDLVTSIGKIYFHTDKTIWIIVEKGTYADIASARTDLETTTVYYPIGTLADAKTNFFTFDDKVYIQDGTNYKSWNGTTLASVEGYVPLVAIATPPAGGGTPNEVINALTGSKHQQFSPDGSTAYQLAETTLVSVDYVYVAGVLKTVTTDYTVNLTTGIVTFGVAPSGSTPNDVDIYWTKTNTSRTLITGNTNSMIFGGQNDNRIFFYGNGTNKYYYTGLASGVPSAEYFPVTNYREIGSEEFEITDIVRQYDRQLIYTNGKETHYSYYDPITDSDGNVLADFPTFPLNNTIGNVTKGQSRLINNNPFSIEENGIYEWLATNVRDERNAELISSKIQTSLSALDLTKAITHDCKKVNEFWLAIDNEVYIYNYKLKLWYKAELYDNITCFLTIDGIVHFATDNGQIMRFNPTLRSDNGQDKSFYFETSFYDFDAEYLEKYMNELLTSLKPEDRAGLVVQYQTNNGPIVTVGTISYNLMTFVNTDFSDWSFETNYNPQPFKQRVNINRFVYLKIILSRTTNNESITILSINLPYRYGSRV